MSLSIFKAVSSHSHAGSLATSSFVIAYIGRERRKFFLHRDLLTSHSQCLTSKLVGAWSDDIWKLTLVDEDSSAFEIIAVWMYTKYIDVPFEKEASKYRSLIKAWLLAVKFGIEACANSILDAIKHDLRGDNMKSMRTVGAETMRRIGDMEESVENYKLRMFFIHRFCWEMRYQPRVHTDADRVSQFTAEYEPFWKHGGQIVSDVMRLFYVRSMNATTFVKTDPATERGCFYHVHNHGHSVKFWTNLIRDL